MTQPRRPLAKLPSVFDVVPVGPQDDPCLNEIREVLDRHNALQRFGVTLLHEHFDVGEDEVLVESIDVGNRTLTLRPMKIDAPNLGLETSWRLDDPVAQRRCEVMCIPITDNKGNVIAHDRNHYQTS